MSSVRLIWRYSFYWHRSDAEWSCLMFQTNKSVIQIPRSTQNDQPRRITNLIRSGRTAEFVRKSVSFFLKGGLLLTLRSPTTGTSEQQAPGQFDGISPVER